MVDDIKKENNEVMNEEVIKEEVVKEDKSEKEEKFEKEENAITEEPVQGEVVEEKVDPFANTLDGLVKDLENIIKQEDEQFPNLFRNDYEKSEEFGSEDDDNNSDLYDIFGKNILNNVPFDNYENEPVENEEEKDFDFMKMFGHKENNYVDSIEDSELIKHAKDEFIYAGWVDQNGKFYDEIQGEICYDILDILKVISDQGHSGSSINYLMDILNRLVKYKSISPLTGQADEWEKSYGLDFSINKRDPRVIKYNDGTCVFTEGRIFVDKYGHEYLDGKNSYVVIKSFPYMPESKYVSER